MSETALLWLALYLLFAVLALVRRSSWGIPLYFLTFFAPPMTSWFGKGALAAIGHRWSLAAALIFLVAVLIDRRPKITQNETLARLGRLVVWLLLLYGLNATIVHFCFADTPAQSIKTFERLWKYFGLFILLHHSLRDRFDLRLFMYTLVAGGLYVGFDVIVHGTGHMENGRLEGVPLGSADDANYLSTALTCSILMAGYLGLFGNWRERVFGITSCAFILEILIRMNSRAMMISSVVGAIILLIRAPGKVRIQAFVALAAAIVAMALVMGDRDRAVLLERFQSIFVDYNERDQSARGRMDMWWPALDMIQDHPLGSGGEAAFKSRRGFGYIEDLGIVDHFHAVHCGYLDIAASWGVQGFLLYLAALIVSYRAVRVTIITAYQARDTKSAFLGVCVEVIIAMIATTAIFLSSLRCEWFYWWMALALNVHLNLAHRENPKVATINSGSGNQT